MGLRYIKLKTPAHGIQKITYVHTHTADRNIIILNRMFSLSDFSELSGFGKPWGWNYKEWLRYELRFTWGWAEVLFMGQIVQMLNWVVYPRARALL
jgi:hypothetical protein